MTPARHALLVGVSHSPWILKHPPPRSKYQQLVSCAKDVDLMREVLVENFDFTGDGIRVLMDGQATQAAILEAMERIAEKAGDGDVVFFYFTGHGSGMQDPREPARKLATIAPFDTGRRPAPNRDIPNLVFDRWVRRLNDQTPNVTLIFDCCHAAELGRDPFSRPVRAIEPDPRPLAKLFDGGRAPAFFSGSREPGPDPRPMMRSGWLPVGRRAVVIAACRSNELSWEIRRRRRLDTFHYGPLTYHLAQAFTHLGPGATWRDVLERVAPRVLAEQNHPERRQHPQIEGDIDGVVYGLGQARAAPYLPVVKADANSVELWGGAAHRVEPESVWSIRPHGTRSRHAAGEVARVRIDHVRPATARGSVEGQPASPIEAGQRAFLIECELPEPGLTVAIDAGDRQREAEAMVRESELLAIAGETGSPDASTERSPDEPDIVVRCIEPRESAGPGDPCPFLGAVERRTWAAVGPKGFLQTRPRPDAAGPPGELITDLEKLARFRGLKSLESPDLESPLRGKLEIRILDRHGDVMPGDEEYSVAWVEEGESVDFEIVNRHDAEVWVSLLELSSDYSITVMMPRRGHSAFRRGGHKLGPGKALRVGRDYYGVAAGIEQYLPEGFPWAADAPEERPDNEQEGKDVADPAITYLKLLVTTVPADFEFLEQERTRIVATHPLRKLALLYHSNAGRRRVILAADDLGKDRDWTVVTRGIGVRRPAGENR